MLFVQVVLNENRPQVRRGIAPESTSTVLSLQKLQFYFLLLQPWAAECEVFHLLQLHMSTLQANGNTKHARSSGQDEFRCQILKPLYVKRDSKQHCDQTGAVYVC